MPVRSSVTLQEFSNGNPFMEELNTLREYVYSINYSKVPLMSSEEVRSAIAGILMAHFVDKLNTLGIYAADNLTSTIENNEVLIAFRDDIFHFQIRMNDSSFSFYRQASKLDEFFWLSDLLLDDVTLSYRAVASYFEGLRTRGGAVFNFSPHACRYGFNFLVNDFQPAGKSSKSSYKNYELMERLVPSVQSETSPLFKMGYKRRGRTDLTISGTLDIAGIEWVAWVSIRAPGNKNYSTMEIEFQLTSVLHETDDNTRAPFNEQSIGQWRIALIDFLRDRVFCGFLQEWLQDVKLSSST